MRRGDGMRSRRRVLGVIGAGGGDGYRPATIIVLGGNDLTPSGVGVVRFSGLRVTGDFTGLNPGARATQGARTISGGVLTAVGVSSGGSVYKPVGDMTISERRCTVTGGGGSGAVVDISTVTGGVVTALTVVTGGSGYTSAPTVVIPPPTGTPAGLPWPDGIGYGDLFTDNVWQQRTIILHDSRGPLEFALPAQTRVGLWSYAEFSANYFVPLWVQ
jgi:hypothetical protein